MAHTAGTGSRIYATAESFAAAATFRVAAALYRRLFARRNRQHNRDSSWSRQIPPALRQEGAQETDRGERIMKTPREVLFERHQSAEPKLDAIRQAAVAALGQRRAEVRVRESVSEPCAPRRTSALRPADRPGVRELLLSFRWH